VCCCFFVFVFFGYPVKSEFFQTCLEGVVFQQNRINWRVKPFIKAPPLSFRGFQEGLEALLKVGDFWWRDGFLFTVSWSGSKSNKKQGGLGDTSKA